MDHLLRDFRYGLRLFRKDPGFTFIAVSVMALSIGANAAIFSVINSVLLRPLPFKEPNRLVRVWGQFDKQGIPKNWISEPEFLELRQQVSSFEDIAAFSADGANLTGAGEPVRVNNANVSAGFFEILGINPILGRTFSSEDDQPGHDQVAILSHALWKQRFASDPEIIGRTVGVNGANVTIVGVLPAGFNYPAKEDLWTPLAINTASPNNRGSHYLEVIARPMPGVTLDAAAADLAQLAANLQQQFPNNYPEGSGWGLYLVPMLDEVVGNIRPALFALLAAVLFVLLIACANIANLLLARSTVREKEIAVRMALGASRSRLIRQLLSESAVLALTGGAVGLVLAQVGVQAFRLLGPRETPRLEEISLDWRVVLISLAITLVTGMLFGLVPAFQNSRPDLHSSLKENSRGSSGGRNRARSIFVLAEIALALVLLAGAGLMIRSFKTLLDVNLGYRTDHLLTMRLSLPSSRYKDQSQILPFYRQLFAKIRELPGVISAGGVTQLPLSGSYASGSTVVEDQSTSERFNQINGYPYIEADRRAVSPDYFPSLDINLIRGRLFTEADNDKAPPVLLVDQAFEKRFWPEGNALGKRIAVGFDGPNKPRWGEIVGVVGHINHYGIDQVKQYALKFEGREQVYFPLEQRANAARNLYLTIKTSVEPTSLAASIREQVQSLDPEQPIYDIRTMDALLSESVSQRQLNMYLFAGFSGIALILAAIGIYGVLSYAVTQRTREIGIRMALGASQSSVLMLVVGSGIKLVAAGLVLGFVAALALTRLMQGLLFGVSATDPVTFTAICVVLFAVALFACLVPAFRAARVEPMVALHHE
ncbi:MAG TPA: ABC transporter permease [Blastocatellia bacterium]|nr:ABC transporter permease [Blastocatellia bacterium]